MEVAVVLDQRYSRTPDGAIWTSAQFSYQYWTRFLTEFDQVRVVARVAECQEVPANALRADGERVTFSPIPYYLGPIQFMRRRQRIMRATMDAITGTEAILTFAPCPIGSAMMSQLAHTGQPYAVAVIADPYEIFAPGIFHHPLRPFFRWMFTRRLRRECQGASAALYVTQHSLQARYPTAPGVLSIACSNVYLPEEAFVSRARSFTTPPPVPRLVLVGAMRNSVKGIDLLLEALALCGRSGLKVDLTIVGEGETRVLLEEQARRLGIAAQVTFRGQLAGEEAVRGELDKADLFLLTSRSEGLPRAMIEAMARGLPCIGTAVGGIPELLAEEDMVAPDQAQALADKISEVVQNAERLNQMAQRNLAWAREYHFDHLRHKSEIFYREIKTVTQQWLAAQKQQEASAWSRSQSPLEQQ